MSHLINAAAAAAVGLIVTVGAGRADEYLKSCVETLLAYHTAAADFAASTKASFASEEQLAKVPLADPEARPLLEAYAEQGGEMLLKMDSLIATATKVRNEECFANEAERGSLDHFLQIAPALRAEATQKIKRLRDYLASR